MRRVNQSLINRHQVCKSNLKEKERPEILTSNFFALSTSPLNSRAVILMSETKQHTQNMKPRTQSIKIPIQGDASCPILDLIITI